jgi:hypothetical protein
VSGPRIVPNSEAADLESALMGILAKHHDGADFLIDEPEDEDYD